MVTLVEIKAERDPENNEIIIIVDGFVFRRSDWDNLFAVISKMAEGAFSRGSSGNRGG